jgi:hypothetical protein
MEPSVLSDSVKIALIIGGVVLVIALFSIFAFTSFFRGICRGIRDAFRTAPREAVSLGKSAATAALDVTEDAADRGLDLAQRAAEVLKSTFKLTPRVVSEKTVLLGASKDILELAVIQKHLRVRHEFTHSWYGSSKRISVSADYIVKIGYDLRKDFKVGIEPHERTTRVQVELPRPEILSIQQQDESLTLAEDTGFWNRIKDSDRAQVLQELNRVAASEALRMELLAQAELQTRVRLIDEMHDAFADLDVHPIVKVIAQPETPKQPGGSTDLTRSFL